jgi:cob(I)alamin adenosyltransferase
MKIYTRTGDKGQTGLFGGARVSKASARVACYGDVDELNSVIGVVRASSVPNEIDAPLARIQLELFDLGAELATVPGKEDKLTSPRIKDAQIEYLEQTIDALEEGLPQLTTFVLPGGTLAASHLHVARTVCRRGERALVALAGDEPVREELVRYLNRLSDLLFTMARRANFAANVADVPWLGRDRA